MSATARAAGLACSGCASVIGLDFQLAPALIGVCAALLVRVPLFKPKARVSVEASFTLLGMLGAFVTIVDHKLSPGNAFWAGIIFGALASSLLEIGKTMARGAIGERVQAAARILFGLNGPPKP